VVLNPTSPLEIKRRFARLGYRTTLPGSRFTIHDVASSAVMMYQNALGVTLTWYNARSDI
jgi:hypothetical protein